MILKEFSASPSTSGTVRVYRLAHFTFSTSHPATVKVYPPRPEHSLQFFIRDQEIAEYPDGRRLTAPCVLTGLHDCAVRRVVPNDFLMLQVAFEPGALHRLLGVPANDLHNQYLDAEALLGPEVRRVNERLRHATSYTQIVDIADAYITQLVAHQREFRKTDQALLLLRDRKAISLTRIAHHSAMSARQFERVCLQRLGMSPKRFARLARFDRAFYLRLHAPERDWLSIALACGYGDYQHMARDFRTFAGVSPAQAIAAQADAPERMLNIAPEFDLTLPPSESEAGSTKY